MDEKLTTCLLCHSCILLNSPPLEYYTHINKLKRGTDGPQPEPERSTLNSQLPTLKVSALYCH